MSTPLGVQCPAAVPVHLSPSIRPQTRTQTTLTQPSRLCPLLFIHGPKPVSDTATVPLPTMTEQVTVFFFCVRALRVNVFVCVIDS